MGVTPRRFEVLLVTLDPSSGFEMQKTRPCVVLSPDEMNSGLKTCIIAPLTTGSRPAPSRVACEFQGKSGLVVLDQLRAVDHSRLVKRLGVVPPDVATGILSTLQQLFAP